MASSMAMWRRLGEILHEDHGISGEAIDRALAEQAGNGRRLGELLVENQQIDPVLLGRALAAQQGLEFLETIDVKAASQELLARIPIGYAKERRIFPLARTEENVVLAVADPGDSTASNDLAAVFDAPIKTIVAPDREILQAIHRGYEEEAGEAGEVIADIGGDETDLSGSLEPADLLDASDEAPVIRFVNRLITQAYKERASDIHIEPFENELIVRFRIDGVLYEVLKPPFKATAAISSRIKIMAGLNIAEKRLPQDGRFRVRIAGRDIDIRVSSLPTTFGERLVLRLLDRGDSVVTLEQLGLGDDLLNQVQRMISKSHGVFLVTGPTGSGKTTTLYAALTSLNDRQKNIITVEDPVEYQLPGVGQIQVNSKINLTFAAGLRSILRQDPDIIMVGEVRDSETAEMMVQSALTGHMVFSTLHTNDASGALTRLVEMGIEPFLTASSVAGVLAQRLVRRLCPDCREAYRPPPEALEEMGIADIVPEDAHFYRRRGCESCMELGYRGRTGIYELLPVDEEVRRLVLANSDSGSIKTAAVKRGMTTLRDAGMSLALSGETSLEEVLRVTQEEE
ncbi:MAG: type II secretion system ATPase GspE [Desulfuromonadales bacterium]